MLHEFMQTTKLQSAVHGRFRTALALAVCSAAILATGSGAVALGSVAKGHRKAAKAPSCLTATSKHGTRTTPRKSARAAKRKRGAARRKCKVAHRRAVKAPTPTVAPSGGLLTGSIATPPAIVATTPGPPSASFSYAPTSPIAGQVVELDGARLHLPRSPMRLCVVRRWLADAAYPRSLAARKRTGAGLHVLEPGH